MVGEELRHKKMCVSSPETHVHACLRSFPHHVKTLKKSIFSNSVFFSKYCEGRPDTRIIVRFRP